MVGLMFSKVFRNFWSGKTSIKATSAPNVSWIFFPRPERRRHRTMDRSAVPLLSKRLCIPSGQPIGFWRTVYNHIQLLNDFVCSWNLCWTIDFNRRPPSAAATKQNHLRKSLSLLAAHHKHIAANVCWKCANFQMSAICWRFYWLVNPWGIFQIGPIIHPVHNQLVSKPQKSIDMCLHHFPCNLVQHGYNSYYTLCKQRQLQAKRGPCIGFCNETLVHGRAKNSHSDQFAAHN